MKGKMKHRASGGVVDKDPSPKDVYAGRESNVAKEADERKRGGRVKKAKEMGKVEGKKAKMRLDRPGRKRGGRVGADRSPLSEAAKVSNPDNVEDD